MKVFCDREQLLAVSNINPISYEEANPQRLMPWGEHYLPRRKQPRDPLTGRFLPYPATVQGTPGGHMTADRPTLATAKEIIKHLVPLASFLARVVKILELILG